MKLRRRLIAGICAVTLASSGGLVLGSAASARSVTGQAGSPYPCSTSNNSQFQAASGLSVDVSAIGWLGNDQGAVACLGGSFFVQNGIDTTYGYGVYNYSPTTWTNADGYLPALVTGFADHGTHVSITNFGDRVVLGGHAYVAVYSRVAVHNPTSHPVTVDPAPSAGLLPLDHAPGTVPPGQTVDHDYVVAADRFGNSYPWPTATQLEHAGGWTEHFAHMRAFWNAQLAKITQLSLPDAQVVDAYKADFIYCQIDRSGVQLDTGTNGYHAEYEHDVIGILNNMFNEGFYPGAHALLNEVDTVVGTNGQYADGLWTYPWLWAVYLEKTGDLAFLRQHFAKPGSLGASKQPSIEATARPHGCGPDRARGDHGGDQRHRRERLLDQRQLRGPARPGVLRLPGQGGRQPGAGPMGRGRVREPAKSGGCHARPHRRHLPPALPAVLDGGAQHLQPLRRPAGRELGRARRLHQRGVARLHDGRYGVRDRGPEHGIVAGQHPALRVREDRGRDTAHYLRRLPGGRFLVDHLQRGLRGMGTRQHAVP